MCEKCVQDSKNEFGVKDLRYFLCSTFHLANE